MSHSPPDGSGHLQPWDQQDTTTTSLLSNDEMTSTDQILSPRASPVLGSGSAAPSESSLSITRGRPQSHHRRVDSFGSIASADSSSSSSSDDGIAWDSSVYDSYQDDSEDSSEEDNQTDQNPLAADNEEDDEEDEDDLVSDEDTQHLLMKSARVSGVRSGLRVGETGTGTTISLDLEDEEDRRSRSLERKRSPFETMRSGRRREDRQHDAENGQAGAFLDDHDGQEDNDMIPMTRTTASTTNKGKKGKRKGKSSKKKRGHRPLEGQMIREAVVGAGALRIEQEERIAKRQMRKRTLWNIFFIMAWYGCSTSLSFYNKWLFSGTHYNFRFPLFTTSLHMVAQFTLSSLTLFAIPSLRPRKAPSPKDLGTKIMPCAVASGLDIGLSNSSLKTITLAFYTMCKSSSLAFVLMFAFLFKLEKPTWKLAFVIGVISVGLFMMVMSEVDFVLIGFIQVMLASFFGGLRWALTQLLLEKSEANKQGSLANPISTIFFLSPIMGVCLLILSGIVEGYGAIFSSDFFSSFWRGLGTLGLLLFGGVIAFLMVLAEFNLIARTSVVSLSVLGIVKEVATILISAMVFHDQLTLVNILGLFVTLAGIGFYHYMKLREMKLKAQRLARQAAEEELAKVARMHEQEQIEAQRRRMKRKLKKQQQNKGRGRDDPVEFDALTSSTVKPAESSLLVDTQPSSSLPHSPQSPNAAAKSPKSVRFQQEPLIIHDLSEGADDEGNDDTPNGDANGITANGHNPFADPPLPASSDQPGQDLTQK
ncbi:Triose-phosphate Transporter [Actinomortierella wolfii]|nr:Triose-phosphate Transporter [Actinomortierella wolfii]